MRVLMLVRQNLCEHMGGDTTQVLKPAEALRARGVQVELASGVQPRMHGYDVVHLFHLDRVWENHVWCRRIRAERRPAVLSTIYWPADEFDIGGRAGFQGVLARLGGSRLYQNLRLAQRWAMRAADERSIAALRGPSWGFRRAVRYILDSVSVLLPNSRAEVEQIERRFGVRRPVVIVPNAADAATLGDGAADETGRRGVLCVGRIEPRKNQLALIEALRGTGIPLRLVGGPGRYSHDYYRRCCRAAGTHTELVGQRSADQLGRYYRAARVHACVSWYETPGLASLEAALCGCRLVVTPGGCTREYFGDEAHYCEPDEPDSIREAVEDALSTEPSDALARRVAAEFTWSAAAARTLAAYEQALRGVAAECAATS
jgi:glycosyltransferase involved in cell wall biosynthesis